MTKPTREEVSMKDKIVVWRGAIKHGVLIKDYNIYMVVEQLCDAYISQEDELKRKDKLIKLQDGFITDKSKIAAERSTQISQLEVELDQLKAENQALKAERERDIQNAINDYRGDLRC